MSAVANDGSYFVAHHTSATSPTAIPPPSAMFAGVIELELGAGAGAATGAGATATGAGSGTDGTVARNADGATV